MMATHLLDAYHNDSSVNNYRSDDIHNYETLSAVNKSKLNLKVSYDKRDMSTQVGRTKHPLLTVCLSTASFCQHDYPCDVTSAVRVTAYDCEHTCSLHPHSPSSPRLLRSTKPARGKTSQLLSGQGTVHESQVQARVLLFRKLTPNRDASNRNLA